MAKAGKTSLIERHAEKGVLAVCVVLLIFVLLNWVVSSPRSVDGRPLDEADKDLAGEAKEIWKKNDEAIEKPRTPRDFSADIKSFQKQPLAGPNKAYLRIWGSGENDLAFVEVAAPAQAISVIPPPIMPRPSLAQVAALVRQVGGPTRPKANYAIELPSREWEANWTNRPRKKVVHCVASYPIQQIEDAWKDLLRTTPLRQETIVPIVLRVYAQYRQRSPGGSWSQEKDVPMSARPIPAGRGAAADRPLKVPDDVPQIPKYQRGEDHDNIKAIEDAKVAVRRDWTEAILQPDYYWLYWAGNEQWQPWQIHLPETEISKAAAAGAPRGAREPLRPSPETTRPRPTKKPTTPVKPPAKRPVKPPAKKPVKAPVKAPAKKPTRKVAPTPPRTRTGAGSRYPTGPEPGYVGGAPPPTGRQPTGRDTRRYGGYDEEGPDYGWRGMDVRSTRGGTTPPGRLPRTGRKGDEPEDPQALPPEPPFVPTLRQQMQDGKVLIWFHQDTDLAEDKEYQFRLRLVLVNPLYGYVDQTNTEADATTLTITTPFSDWSETTSLKRSTEFFLVGRAPLQRTVRVRVFAHYLGRWFRQDYTVNEGEPIGGKKAVKMHKPPAPPDAPAMLGAPAARARAAKEDPVLENVTVDFATGVVSVEFDFEKKYVNPKFASMKHDTVEMLYLDHLGRLGRRIPENDKDNTRYKELKELTERKSIKRVAGRP